MRTEFQDNGCCFVCGKNNTIGLKLLFARKPDAAEAEFIPSKELQGYSGIVHGGIISAVLDEAMIQASMSEKDTPVTAEIKVRFRNPLKVDEQATVYASVKKRAGRLIEADAAMRKKSDNTLIAEAHAKLMCTA
ncbi:MAG: PaaI family thioesterase [Nitrospirae bacterium]|nr:MAG: PaaI family thioesterase [Nitrospirota bacterium]